MIGIGLLIAEAHLPTHGILGAVGVIALAASGLFLFNTDSSQFEVSAPVVIVVALLLGGGLSFAVTKAVAARRSAGANRARGAGRRDRRRPRSAQPGRPGVRRRARSGGRGSPTTRRPSDAERVRERGARVRVEAVEGLTLRVRPQSELIAEREQGAAYVTVAIAVIAVLAVLILIILAAAIRILREYERGVIFRLGRLIAQKGPGLILLIPFIDQMVRIDLRTITLNVPPQEVITKDNVTVRVNAVAYFRVLDPNKAVTEVENFLLATSQIAQTTLRSVLGKAELDALLSERERLNLELQQIIDEQTEPWGIKVSTVEVKDVELPADMQKAMSRQAEAERERRAKIIAADGEFQAAEKLSQAANIISENPATLQLRYLQTLVEIGVNNSSTIVFPLPLDLIKPLIEPHAQPSVPTPATPPKPPPPPAS